MATTIDAGVEPAPMAGAKPEYSRGYLSWLLGLLVAIYASSFLDRVIISTVGPAIISDLRISDTLFGLLTGPAFAVFYVVLGIPIARAAERSSRINIISICIALWSLMTVLCGMASSFVPLLLFRMGVGVGEGGCSPAAHSLLSDHFPPRRRATALAVYFAGVPFGIMLGAILGGWLATAFNWRMAFMVLGVPGVLLALLAKLTLREPPRGHSDGAAPPAEAPSLGAVLKRLITNPTVVLLVCGLVAANFGGSGQQIPPARDAAHDIQTALEAWVEQGVAPASLVATKFTDDKAATRTIKSTRLLCPYPQVARYNGTGDVGDAGSFACVAP